jgi:hypothetical protein
MQILMTLLHTKFANLAMISNVSSPTSLIHHHMQLHGYIWLFFFFSSSKPKTWWSHANHPYQRWSLCNFFWIIPKPTLWPRQHFFSLWSSSSHPQYPFCPIRLEERRKIRSKSWTRFSSPLWHFSSPLLDPQPAPRSSPPQHPTLPGSGSSYQALAHRSLSQYSRVP